MSCPGECDAHVVFHPAHNGTVNAFSPDSSRTKPKKCISGQKCTICFDDTGSSCMEVRYRGNGPPRNRFDFTLAFYDEMCESDNIFTHLQTQCHRIGAFSERLNCFKEPDNERCQSIMQSAEQRKQKDDRDYTECRSLGESAYNKKMHSHRSGNAVMNVLMKSGQLAEILMAQHGAS